MLVELIGGIWTNSLVLLADAGHMLTDVGAIGLALFTAWFVEHPASPQKTYGYYRLEIFAALINGVALFVISIGIFYEAFHRMQTPSEIKGVALTWIATGGLIVNLLSAAILYAPGQKNINMRAAFMHVISDSLGSIGAIIAGLSITYFGFYQADPVLSIIIAILVLINAWKLIEEASNVLLEASPKHLNVAEIQNALLDLPEVESLHDLHVWSITSGKEALSAHVVVKTESQFSSLVVSKIQQVLKERFHLTHITIQLETPDFEEDDIHF